MGHPAGGRQHGQGGVQGGGERSLSAYEISPAQLQSFAAPLQSQKETCWRYGKRVRLPFNQQFALERAFELGSQ